MYRGINIVDMYQAGDYPFNEYPDFVTFKKYLDIAKNDLNCNFIRLFLLRDFEEHYPDWINRWTAAENLIQEHNFAVEYCTYMFWDVTTINIDSYKNWVNKYIGTYRDLGMPTDRIWTVNVLENPWANYNVAQQMMPYIKITDPDRIVTTEVWGSTGGMYNDEIIGLPSTKGEPLINSRVYIQPGNLISTADYSGGPFIPTADIWTQLKTHAPTCPVLISEFSGDITNRVNLAILNGAYGVCYWDLHLTDNLRTPINNDYTLNSKGIELRNAYAIPPILTSIALSPASAYVSIGSTIQLTATCKDQNINTMTCPTLTWLSSNTSKVTVDSTGRVTGVAEGYSIITTAASGIISELSVVIVPPITHILTSIVLSPVSASVSIGSTTQLTATCKDQNTNTMTCPTLTWLSSDSSKATVDSTGRVTGVAAGTTNITATYGSLLSNSSVITVPPVTHILTSIVLSPVSASVSIGSMTQLTATCKDQNTNTMTCPTLTWLSSDSSKATVDSTGRVTGVAAGTTNVWAIYGSVTSNQSVITVPPVTHILTSIVVSPASAPVNIGSDSQLTATCKDQNTNTMTCPTLTWLSSDSSKATVDSTGRVTGVAAGTTNITATYGSLLSNSSVITIPPVPNLGVVNISSTPVGAKIYIKSGAVYLYTGYVTGTPEAPAVIGSLIAGTYDYKLTLNGYNDHTDSFVITTNNTTIVNPTLVATPPTTGTLSIWSSPPGARIWTKLGTGDWQDTLHITGTHASPTLITGLSTGDYSYKLVLAQYEDYIYTGTLTIDAGQTVLTNAALVPIYIPPTLTSIVVSPASASVSIGSTTQLTATCKDQNTNTMTCPTLTWLSSDSSKATVDSTGRVTGVAAGTTNITATYGSLLSNSSVVTVPPVTHILTSIVLSPASASVSIGSMTQLTATCKDQNTNTMTCPTLTWLSSDSSKATVDSTGRVTGVAAGTTNVWAIYGSVTSNQSVITATIPPPAEAGMGGIGIIIIAGIGITALISMKNPVTK